jgi:hypothetical protein
LEEQKQIMKARQKGVLKSADEKEDQW